MVIQSIIEAAAFTQSDNVQGLLPQLEEEETVTQAIEKDLSIEQQIECRRCHDVMTLHSEFDRLGYYCEECGFSLHLSH